MPQTTVIRKVFGSGQITLPKTWRNRIKTDTVSVHQDGDELRIKPLKIPKTYTLSKAPKNVIFDSAELGYPEGVEVNQFLKALKKAISITKKKNG